MPNLIGQSLGRYHILEQLGEGGMAVVYKAYDTRLEREVAVKVLRTEQFGPAILERIQKRFEREAKALAKLFHPNIVNVHDFGEYEGQPFLVMDFLRGGTLKDKLGKPIPWQEACRLLITISEALAYAHEHGILHRDVKPSNILLTERGQTLLTDFGIAKILDLEGGETLTGTGVGIGTPEYMSPEQGLGNPVTAATDIYSLGVVFYELIAGRKPYTANTPIAVVVKHLNDPLPHPGEFISALPQAVENSLLKALAKNPQDRFLNMNEFSAALEKLLTGVQASTGTLPTVVAGLADQNQPTTLHHVDQGTVDQGTVDQGTVDQGRTSETATPETVVPVPPPVKPAGPDSSKPPKKKRKAWLIWLAVVGGLVAVISVLLVLYQLSNTYNTASDPAEPTPEFSIIGYWFLYTTWDCTAYGNPDNITFFNDNTFKMNEDSDTWGTWSTVGDYVDFTFTEYPNAHYVGTIVETDYLEGTMITSDGLSGCWIAMR